MVEFCEIELFISSSTYKSLPARGTSVVKLVDPISATESEC